ncbi:hypothetical protein F5Y10DRAFT_58702 [Nemania abortiva]|nr:hypothetical protein F5Y10DRAFT_58702 [Nemania abortiva]
MMASLPWRRAAEVKEKEEDVWVMYMDPSQEAAAAGHQRLFMPKIRGTAQRLSHSENQFFDQINNRGLVNNFSQFDYLQAALDMLKLVASTTLVHLPWAEAILDAYRSLRGDRQSLYEHYTLGARRLWASQWFFKVPQYRNYVGRVENGVPREMRRNASTDKWEYVP